MSELGRAAVVRYQHDPVGFVEEILGLVTWPRMAEMLCAFRDFDRVAVRAGQKVSKSTTIAALGLWWTSTRPRGRFIYTSASARQVREIIYDEELVRLHRNARVPLGGNVSKDPEHGISWPDGRSIVGFTADPKKPERFLGYSGPALAFAADEASGIESTVLETIDGNRSGGAKIILAGNPTRSDGYFAEAFGAKRAFWKTLRISSEESPNFVSGKRLIPGLATRDFIEEKRREWGVDSPMYQVKILGEFAGQDDRAFVSVALVDAAIERWTKEPSPEDLRCVLHVGVDPARFGGDETAIVLRRGFWTSRPFMFDQRDNVQVAQHVVELIRSHMRAGERPIVKVDMSNNNAVADLLKRVEGLQVVEVMAQEHSPDRGFARMRDLVWGALREWLAAGAIANDPKLAADITAPRWDWDLANRVKVESKRDLRVRLGRSTDRADALALAAYEGGAATRANDAIVLSDEFDDMPKAII